MKQTFDEEITYNKLAINMRKRKNNSVYEAKQSITSGTINIGLYFIFPFPTDEDELGELGQCSINEDGSYFAIYTGEKWRWIPLIKAHFAEE